MNRYRQVKALLHAELRNMDGLFVRQAFPTMRVDMVDPFLLLHHGEMKVTEHMNLKHAGVAPHPHRGFSPVTFIFKGGVHHRDSRGNDSTIYAGGVQWMNAGMGVMHSERPPKDILALGGVTEIIQMWVNTPAAHKMDLPRYFPLTKEQIPEYRNEDGKISVHVSAGELMGVKGPITAISPVNAATLNLQAGGRIYIPLPTDHNAFLYLLDGKVNLDGYGLMQHKHAAVFEADGEGIGLEVLEPGKALLMSGLPLNEKVVANGPFVMNSDTQILEAMRDYRMGKMGILIED